MLKINKSILLEVTREIRDKNNLDFGNIIGTDMYMLKEQRNDKKPKSEDNDNSINKKIENKKNKERVKKTIIADGFTEEEKQKLLNIDINKWVPIINRELLVSEDDIEEAVNTNSNKNKIRTINATEKVYLISYSLLSNLYNVNSNYVIYINNKPQRVLRVSAKDTSDNLTTLNQELSKELGYLDFSIIRREFNDSIMYRKFDNTLFNFIFTEDIYESIEPTLNKLKENKNKDVR